MTPWCRSRRWLRVAGGAVIAITLTAGSVAGDAEPVGPDLTDKLRGLLVKEMVEIEVAMQETYSAIVQGRHDEVARRGQAIHDSFILEQSLTPQDRRDLKGAVPAEFLELDARLHRLAASLAEAGRERNTPRQVDLFGRMTDSCVACHSRYVTDRFGGLEAPSLPERPEDGTP
ncbi:hypothetical protein FEI13_05445 [Halomonas urmiana]|uniref:Cytochrome c n=1 Tax=Halomonas urmiana TaxID=490901 RepID=A0A5R8MM92_9GAMM|nr:hypothetical protein [Halomonas urmiana]TLF52312.1 hypothetical protein FEI13_05445 [Halomonas urmiana]